MSSTMQRVMSARLHRSAPVHLVLGLALFACVPSKVNTNTTRTRTFASVRVLNLLSDVTTAETIISVKDDLPGGFAPVAAPGVSPFQPVATGSWTAYLTQQETASTSSAELTVTEGQRLTIIQAGLAATATLTWKLEQPPTLTADQSAARIVAAAPILANASITLDGAPAIPSAVLGAPSDWSTANATAVRSVVVSLPGQATRFDVPAAASGQLHTFALVQASSTDTSLRLVDFAEAPGGDATGSSPLSPTP